MKNLFKRPKAEGEETKYYWDKYNAPTVSHSVWNKYAVNTTNTYRWDRYNLYSTTGTQYIWNKYNATTIERNLYSQFRLYEQPATRYVYHWDRYTVAPAQNAYYSWVKSTPKYMWNKYEKVGSGEPTDPYIIDSTTDYYSPRFVAAGYDANGSTISDYDVDEEEYTFFGEKYNVFAVNSDFDYISNWYVQIKFYQNAVLNASTGRMVYSNPFMYNGNAFVATVHWPRYKYNNNSTVSISKFSDFGTTSDLHRVFFCSDSNNTDDTTTQYVFSNNLIDLDTYKYMEITPIYTGGDYDTYYLNPAVIRVTPNNQMKPSGFNFYDMICNYISAQVVRDGNSVAVLWQVSNVAINYIIENPNAGDGVHAGSFIETVTANTANAYPQNGVQGDYWYIAAGAYKGTEIETVTSSSGDTYPDGDVLNGYWYSEKTYHAAGTASKGTYIGKTWSLYKLSSTVPFPEDGVFNNTYYVYTGSEVAHMAREEATYYPACTDKDWDFISGINHLEINIGDTITFAPEWDLIGLNSTVDYGTGERPSYEGQYAYIPDQDLLSSVYKTITVTSSNINTLWSGYYDGHDSSRAYDYDPFVVNATTIPSGAYKAGTISGQEVYYQFETVAHRGHFDEQTEITTYNDEDTPITAMETHSGHKIRTSLVKLSFVDDIPPFNYTYAPLSLMTYYGLWYQLDNTLSPTQFKQNLIYTIDGYYEAETLMGEVRSDTRNAYPDNGAVDGYYYIYQGSQTGNIYRKNSRLGTVSSTSISAYPQDGIQGNYWYVYKDVTASNSKGSLIGEVTDTFASAYPADGILNGYWYTQTATGIVEPIKGTYVDTIYSTTSNTYPDDGVQDGYWYVKWPNDNYYPAWHDHNILNGVTYKQNINPDADYIIGAVAAATVEFNSTIDFTNNMTNTVFKYFNNQNQAPDMTAMGIFNITAVEKQSSGGFKITGVDNISKFDIYCDNFIETVNYPITLQNFFINLCTYCGATYDASSMTVNYAYGVNDNFEGTNITGRQLLGYIAEAAGGYIYADVLGRICVGYYKSKGTTLDDSKYVSYFTNDFTTPQIGKLVIQMTTNDVGTIAENSTGTAQYNITNNPLFYNDSISENQEAANRLLSSMSSVSYTPATITLLEDYNINCGDIITVDGDTIYVMEKSINDSGVTLVCKGNKERQTEGSSINSEIVALRGKSNELTRTIEETRSLITDTTNGLQSQLKQTSDSFNLAISKLNNTVSEINADLNGISLTYNSSNGTASLRIGDVVVRNLVNDEYVEEAVAGIEMNGYVKFNDLQRSGSTTINGDNITTGTISADRLDLTGSISWGDLTNSAKNQIRNIASSGSVPDYIHSTYIDEVTIYSPTIYGAKITAGTRADGYVELASTGMNFCSNRGGALIGLGYYAGNYMYPYMVLGQGVDEWGTNRGMIKKFANGIWIGDSDSINSSTVGAGTGLFVNFVNNKLYKYENGNATQL